jgi:signal transduction histidine kinase/ActR/RegA family two-component response regulator
VAAELELDRLVQLVTDAATDLTGAQAGAFFYNVSEAGGEPYRLYASSGPDRALFERFPMPREAEVLASTFRGEGIVRSDDIRQDPRFASHVAPASLSEGDRPLRSYLAVPVVSRAGEPIGGLFFGHADTAVFDERAERMAAGIAAQAAIGIDNARLFQASQRELAARTVAEAALRESEARLTQVGEERERLLLSERAARSEAERLSHVKDEFLATLSHELRTPLNAIQGWAVLLRQPQLEPPDRERGLASIERNTRAQAQIINDLLDMSRIIAGKLHLEMRTVDLRDVINAAIEAVAPAAEARRVSIVPRLDATVVTRADPNRMQQVMWNLLSNAVKFTPAQGQIEISLARAGPLVEIRVSDTGIGIQPDFLPYVFDRFRQADASTTRRYGGLGLGLSIVRNLVELHGGTVRAESDGEGRGSCFVVSLPPPDASAVERRLRAGVEPPDAPRPAPETIELPRLDRSTILIVDDEPDTRELMQRIIEGRGATVVSAGSAAEALEILAAGVPVDLMVSDIAMPGTDGYALIRQIRESERERGRRPLAAIAATAYARAEDRQRSLLAGYQLHIAKPVEPRELIAAVASLLRVTVVG